MFWTKRALFLNVLACFAAVLPATAQGGSYKPDRRDDSAPAATRAEPQLSVVYAFQGGADGAGPGSLVFDDAGNLYGVTSVGGSTNCISGRGTVFKIATDGTRTTLHSFAGGPGDGKLPVGLAVDRNGNVYGTMVYGGASLACNAPSGCGSVFKVSPDGVRTTLHDFLGPANGDGAYPVFGLIRGKGHKRDVLYGTTATGPLCGDGSLGGGCGMVFKIEE